MSETKSGHRRRYPKHAPAPLTRMSFDGRDLGHAMSPQDILLYLLRYHDESALIEAMAAGVERLAHDLATDAQPTDNALPALWIIPHDERVKALEEARGMSRSRLQAWRRRHLPMTWRELRVMMLGLRIVD